MAAMMAMARGALGLLLAALLGGVAQIAQAQVPTCDVDFNGAGGGAFSQALCESPTFGGGQGFLLASPLPSGACHPVLALQPLSTVATFATFAASAEQQQ